MPDPTEPHLIDGETTARELEALLGDSVRLTLFGQGREWNAVAWRGAVFGTGKAPSWYLAVDRAVRSLNAKEGK